MEKAKPAVLFDAGKCKACWKCLDVCPQQVIGKVNIIIHKHAVMQKTERCIGCMKCVRICPNGAFGPTKQQVMYPSENRLFKSRRIISVVLFVSLISLPITGILISIAETISNDFLLHFSTVIHGFTGIVFTVFGILHTVKNWRTMKIYINKASKK